MKNMEQNIAKSFSLVKKDINKLYSMVEELRLKVDESKTSKVAKKRERR